MLNTERLCRLLQADQPVGETVLGTLLKKKKIGTIERY